MTDRQLLEAIRQLADGRRHYDGTDDYTCFDALGEIRQKIDEHVGTPMETNVDRLFDAWSDFRDSLK